MFPFRVCADGVFLVTFCPQKLTFFRSQSFSIKGDNCGFCESFVEASPVRKILFGFEPLRNRKILKQIDNTRFAAEFRSFDSPLDWEKFDAIIPLTLPDQWHLQRVCPDLNGTRFLTPNWPLVELAHDKPRFNRFLCDQGLDAYVPYMGNWQRYPFVLKKNRDAGAEHTHLIESIVDEQRWAAELASSDYFCQEYVPGQVEYTTHLLFDGGVRYQMSVRFDSNQPWYIRGVATQASRGIRMSRVSLPCENVFSRILDLIGYRGTCCFNYKLIGGRPMIFEMNPRIGGSLPLDLNNYLDTVLSVLGRTESHAEFPGSRQF